MHSAGPSLHDIIYAIVHSTKTGCKDVYFTFDRGVHASICALTALQRWLQVLRVNGFESGPLFPLIISGILSKSDRMTHSVYSTCLGYMSNSANLPGHLTEHSARRGGSQYHHYVLLWSIPEMLAVFNWRNEEELRKYLGASDKPNSYFLLGFGGGCQWK